MLPLHAKPLVDGYSKRYAWLPTHLDDGSFIWFNYFYSVLVLSESGNMYASRIDSTEFMLEVLRGDISATGKFLKGQYAIGSWVVNCK